MRSTNNVKGPRHTHLTTQCSRKKWSLKVQNGGVRTATSLDKFSSLFSRLSPPLLIFNPSTVPRTSFRGTPRKNKVGFWGSSVTWWLTLKFRLKPFRWRRLLPNNGRGGSGGGAGAVTELLNFLAAEQSSRPHGTATRCFWAWHARPLCPYMD